MLSVMGCGTAFVSSVPLRLIPRALQEKALFNRAICQGGEGKRAALAAVAVRWLCLSLERLVARLGQGDPMCPTGASGDGAARDAGAQVGIISGAVLIGTAK